MFLGKQLLFTLNHGVILNQTNVERKVDINQNNNQKDINKDVISPTKVNRIW